jgi:trimethylamine--corrinoid protein Co-methyltransferase
MKDAVPLPDGDALPSSPALSLLTEAHREYLHEKTLEVLTQTGASFESNKARALLDAAGCKVEEDGDRVRFPRDLVEWAISKMSASVLLAARDPQRDVLLDGSRTFVTTTGICPRVVDLKTGAHREPTLVDLANAGLLVDALDDVDLCWYAISPTADVPYEMLDLVSLACLAANTSKHIQGQLIRPDDVPCAIELMRLSAPERGKTSRFFSSLYCPVSPLTHGAETSEAGMAMAAEAIPIDLYSLALSGATGPMSLAGTVIQTLVEELSAAVLFKVTNEDCPLILTGNAGILDMSASRYESATPECCLMNVALIEMIRSYGAPTQSIGLAMDSFELDFRGGLENMGVGLLTWLARPDMMTGLGGVGGAHAFSMSKLLLDAEMVRYYARLKRGVAVDSEHAAVDSIGRVGPGGNYLKEKETVRMLRSGEHWQPRLLRRGSYEQWLSERPNAQALAAERVEEILATHDHIQLSERAVEAMENALMQVRRERTGIEAPFLVAPIR